jgi:lipid A 4'-phosphatase
MGPYWAFDSVSSSMKPRTRVWLPEALLLVTGAVAVTVIFAVTPLDIDAARVFYNPVGPDHWPLASHVPWSILYRSAPPIAASLLLVGLAILVAGYLRRHDRMIVHGTFLLLTVVLGPGLIINAVFKDHWDHPRPRDIVEFSGSLHYAVAPLRGEGGKSFPCGHCSVGFLCGAGWWVWKRRRPAWAYGSIALGIATGTALGLGRMAAGGHFLSDVVWSALLAWGVAHTLYYHVMRIPDHEGDSHGFGFARISATHLRQTLVTISVLGALAALIALFVTAHGRSFAMDIDLSSLTPTPRVLEITAPTANIDIEIVDSPAMTLHIEGELHGFGLPGSVLDTAVDLQDAAARSLRFRIEQRGLITDLDSSATIRVPPADLERIVVRLQHGDIRITDTTRAHVVASRRLHLDVGTGAGHVQGVAGR